MRLFRAFKKKKGNVKHSIPSQEPKKEIPISHRCDSLLTLLTQLHEMFGHLEKVFIGSSGKISYDENDPSSVSRALKMIKASTQGIRHLVQVDHIVVECKDLFEKDDYCLLDVYQRIQKMEEEIRKVQIDHFPEFLIFRTESFVKDVRHMISKFEEYVFSILECDGIALLALEMPHVLSQMSQMSNYKKRFLDLITCETRIKLELAIKGKSLAKGLEALSTTMEDQMKRAKGEIGKCLSGMDISSFYVGTINMFVREYVESLMEKKEELDYGDMLALLYWLRIEYGVVMEQFTESPIDWKKHVEILMQHFMVEKTRSMLEGCKVALEQDFTQSSAIMMTTHGVVMSSGIELFTMLNTELEQIVESRNTRWDFLLQICKLNASSILLYLYGIEDKISSTRDTISPHILYAYINTGIAGKKMLSDHVTKMKQVLKEEFHNNVDQVFDECHHVFDHVKMTCQKAIGQICLEESPTVESLGETLDRFHKEDHLITKECRREVYEIILEMFVTRYVHDWMKDGKMEPDKMSDDISNLRDLFLCFDVNEEELLYPLMGLKSFLRGIERAKGNVDLFVLSFHEFLKDFPFAWDAAERIVKKCGNDQKFLQVIADSFKKDCKSVTDPGPQNHVFMAYVKKYDIYKEVEKRPKEVSLMRTLDGHMKTLKRIFVKDNIEVIDLEQFIGERLEID